MLLHLRAPVARHEVRQLRVQHEVQVAHLIIVRGPGLDGSLDRGGVKQACGLQGVSRLDDNVCLEWCEALWQLWVLLAQLLFDLLSLDLCYALEVDRSAEVQRQCRVRVVCMHNTL